MAEAYKTAGGRMAPLAFEKKQKVEDATDVPKMGTISVCMDSWTHHEHLNLKCDKCPNLVGRNDGA